MKLIVNCEVKSLVSFIFKTAWLLFALLLYLSGLFAFFLPEPDFGTWCIWGGFCCVPTIGNVIGNAFIEAKAGWRRGANDYTVSTSGNTVTVSNHPFMGMLISIFVSGFFSVLVGPVTLAIGMIGTAWNATFFMIGYVKSKKTPSEANNTSGGEN